MFGALSKHVLQREFFLQVTPPETRISEIDSGPIISDITYEQPVNDSRHNAVPSVGGKSAPLTIAPPDTAASAVAEPVITSPASAADLTDEVVLCENLFDDDVDLAFQAQQPTTQPQSGRQHQQTQDFAKFDMDQTLNTPRVEWEDHHQPIPGTSSKQISGPLTTSNAGAAAGMQVALQIPSKTACKTDSALGKNK